MSYEYEEDEYGDEPEAEPEPELVRSDGKLDPVEIKLSAKFTSVTFDELASAFHRHVTDMIRQNTLTDEMRETLWARKEDRRLLAKLFRSKGARAALTEAENEYALAATRSPGIGFAAGQPESFPDPDAEVGYRITLPDHPSRPDAMTYYNCLCELD